MVGMSHAPLRAVLRDYLPQGAKTTWPTEMLNSRRIPKEELGATAETGRNPVETYLVPQILGNEEGPIRDSVKKLVDWGADAIDINMGCPVQKALRHNYGVALMGDAEYAAKVVEMTVRHSSVPVSVKLRAGLQSDFEYLKNFALGLEAAGASWLCLHPRTAEQKRRGRADWSQIKRLKSELKIPLVGNGDIQTAEDVLLMQKETGCDMVMSGRALAAKPWLLWQVGEKLGMAAPESQVKWRADGSLRSAPQTREEEGLEYGRTLVRLLEEMEAAKWREDLILRKFRYHVRMTSMWLAFGQEVISISTKSTSPGELKTALLEFFSHPQEMSERTDLLE